MGAVGLELTEPGEGRQFIRVTMRKLARMSDDKPNIVIWARSKRSVFEGYPFSNEIYRFESDQTWTLVVVRHEGSSLIWDEVSALDLVVGDMAIQAIEPEGVIAFIRGDSVFPRRRH